MKCNPLLLSVHHLPHVKMIVNVSLHKLHCYEVLAFPSIVQDQSVLVRCLQLEVDVDQVKGLHLR